MFGASLELGARDLVRSRIPPKKARNRHICDCGYDAKMGILSVDMIMGFDESFFGFNTKQ
jgi:hypothetical protein